MPTLRFTRLFAVCLTVSILAPVGWADEPAAPSHVAVTPQSRGDNWWMPRHEERLKMIADADGKIDLIWIGDSITHGWDNQGDLWNRYYAKRHPLNLGFSGDRTEHVLWRLDNGEIDGIQPKLAIIMIGTNNIGHGSSTPEQTVDGIKAIIGRLQAKLPETKILLLAVFPRGADENDNLRQKVNQINQALPALADGEKVVFLSIGDKFLEADGVLPRSIMPDLLHPNPKGYEIWAEAIEPTVKKMMGEE